MSNIPGAYVSPMQIVVKLEPGKVVASKKCWCPTPYTCRSANYCCASACPIDPQNSSVATENPSLDARTLNDSSGVKYDADKPRYDLLPESLEEIVRVFTLGAAKYTDRNWEKGMRYGRIFAALMRHAWAWWWGEDNDPELQTHHMANVAWCAMVLITFAKRKIGTDDRPKLTEDGR